jgi:hemolysin TlyA family protein
MKERLDLLLVRRGLCPTRQRARMDILEGHVFVDGRVERKPGRNCEETVQLELVGESLRYVSRGGLKLEKALRAFQTDPGGKVCLDCGASTGGFTDCLLQNGAARVYALDVGTGQLAPSLLGDPRVISMENVNARALRPGDLPETPELAVIDVSFISLRLVVPAVRALLTDAGEIICLIKPQFEAGRRRLGKSGIVRDPETQLQVLEELLAFFPTLELYPAGLTYSPIRGDKGNTEYLCLLRRAPPVRIPEPRLVVEEARRELK